MSKNPDRYTDTSQFWVIFDTCTRDEYIADVHELLALPMGAIIRYEYRGIYLSDAAQNVVRSQTGCGPRDVLFVYAQYEHYDRARGDAYKPSDGERVLYRPTRLGRMRAVTGLSGDKYVFDIELAGYPKVSEDALLEVLRPLVDRGETPWSKWVAFSNATETMPARFWRDGDSWTAVVDALAEAPLQFVKDYFWRLRGVQNAAKNPIAPMTRERSSGGLGFVFPALAEESMHLKIESHSPKGLQVPARRLVASSKNDELLIVERGEVELRQYTVDELVLRVTSGKEDRAREGELTLETEQPKGGGHAARLLLTFQRPHQKLGWPTVRIKDPRVAVGTLLLGGALGVWLFLRGTRGVVDIRETTPEYAPLVAESPAGFRDDMDIAEQQTTFGVELAAQPVEVADWRAVLSFVHISDVQIRDFGIVLDSRDTEGILDRVADGARRPERLDSNDEYPFLALVGGLNRIVSDRTTEGGSTSGESPSFVIHTGDAIDVGTDGELVQFLNVANRLDIPWFNVVGNHDVFLFGNFSQRNMQQRIHVSNLDFVTSRDKFMEAHGVRLRGLLLGEPDPHFMTHGPTEGGSDVIPNSFYHGFDLTANGAGETRSSYYSFVVATNPALRLVVLDTVAQDEDAEFTSVSGIQMPGIGAWARRLDEGQFNWLNGELTAARQAEQYVLVFGHHPLKSGEGELRYRDPGLPSTPQLSRLLAGNPRVLGYFAGHSHHSWVERWESPVRGQGAHFAEVIAPSVHEHPQVGLLVHVLEKDSRLAIAIRPIRGTASGPSGAASRLAAAREAAQADASDKQLEMRVATSEVIFVGAYSQP